MTIVATSGAPAEAPSAPPVSTSELRGRRLTRLWMRALAAALCVAVGKLLGGWLYRLPVLTLLGTTSVTFAAVSVLFGWTGVVVATMLQLLYLGLLEGFGAYTWASVAAYGAAGALAWVVFRYVPRLGRSIPDSHSFAWITIAGGLGGLISSSVICAVTSDEPFLDALAVWSRSTIVSLWLFVPPLVLLGERALRPLLAPIPDEPAARLPRRVVVVRSPVAGRGQEVVGVETREVTGRRELLIATAAVTLITLGKIYLAGGWGSAASWWNIPYLVVIWWMVQRLRLMGALFGIALVSVATLAARSAVAGSAPLSREGELEVYAVMLALWVFGVLLGLASNREGRLLEEVTELHGRVEEDLQRIVLALSGAVEAKDPYTGAHLQRVKSFALEVGRRMGLGGRDLELLQIASTLHDIGKIGIPESILNKPGPLSAEERRIMERHPEIGAQLLLRIEGLREAAPLVLHHQERWDGRRDVRFPGYPDGLAGEAIPVGARIIAVVDAFDAITTDRPYRPAKPAAAARQTLVAERGAQFDPAVVDSFLRTLDEVPWDGDGRPRG